jgi:hypothetical protein
MAYDEYFNPYTREDLENVQAAEIALAKGERVVSVSTLGRTVQYGPADLDKLGALAAKIKRCLAASSGQAHFVLTATSKGL